MCALNLHQDVQSDGFVKKFQTALEYSLLMASKAFKKNSHNYELCNVCISNNSCCISLCSVLLSHQVIVFVGTFGHEKRNIASVTDVLIDLIVHIIAVETKTHL